MDLIFVILAFLLLNFIELGRVNELASVTVWTVRALMELLTELCLIS